MRSQRRRALLCKQRTFTVEQQGSLSRPVEVGHGATVGQQQADRGILGLKLQPLTRERRIQRHVRRTTFEHRQQCHRQLRGAWQAQAYRAATTEPARAQQRSQLIRSCLQHGIAESVVTADNSSGRGMASRLHQFIHTSRPLHRRYLGALAPATQPVALGR